MITSTTRSKHSWEWTENQSSFTNNQHKSRCIDNRNNAVHNEEIKKFIDFSKISGNQNYIEDRNNSDKSPFINSKYDSSSLSNQLVSF